MTDYGMIIRNNANRVMIDSVYKNYTYYESGSTFLNAGINEISITNTTESLILVIKPNSDATVYPYGFLDTTTTGTYESIMLAADATCTCEWLLYKDGPSNAVGDYGLIIYDSTSNVVFTSNEDGYTNIVDSYPWSINNVDPETDYTDVDVSDTTNYFQLMGNNYRAEASSGIEQHWVVGMKKFDSDTVRLQYISIYYDGDVAYGASSAVISAPQYLFEFNPPPSL